MDDNLGRREICRPYHPDVLLREQLHLQPIVKRRQSEPVPTTCSTPKYFNERMVSFDDKQMTDARIADQIRRNNELIEKMSPVVKYKIQEYIRKQRAKKQQRRKFSLACGLPSRKKSPPARAAASRTSSRRATMPAPQPTYSSYRRMPLPTAQASSMQPMQPAPLQPLDLDDLDDLE